MNPLLAALLCFSLLSLRWAQNPPIKRALIIAIGDYPKETGWQAISSANDVDLIKRVLHRQGFTDANITVVQDTQAKRDGIMKALLALIERAHKGDKVVIHFSSHGQQITDTNNDEADRYDEAIVCYGAPESATGNYRDYTGDQHLRDEDLGKLLDSLREKLGSDGDVLLLVDACHSGTITRGSTSRLRGSTRPMKLKGYRTTRPKTQHHAFLYRKPVSQTGVAPYVAISAASASEANSECWVGRSAVGSLSYAFNQALQHSRPGESYRALFARIQSVMKSKVPGQTPQIEGDIDRALFGGNVVEQAKYLSVSDVRDNGKRLLINSGQLNGIFDSTKVVICKSGTTSPQANNTLAVGMVVRSTPTSAEILLNKALPGSNPADFWGFVTEYVSADWSVSILLDSLTNSGHRQQIRAELGKNKLVRFSGTPDLYVKAVHDGNRVQLYRADGTPLDTPIALSQVSLLSQQVQRYAQSQYLQQLNFQGNGSIQFTARLIPMKPWVPKNSDDRQLPEDTVANVSGFMIGPMLTFTGNQKENSALLITNTGSVPIYFTLLDIMPNGDVEVLLPCRYDPNDPKRCEQDRPENYRVNPGERKLTGRTISYSPPYGKETFKILATTEPVDLRDVVGRSRGSSATRGTMQQLKRLYDDTNDMVKLGVGTRGGGTQSIPDDANIATQNIEFEIIRDRSTLPKK